MIEPWLSDDAWEDGAFGVEVSDAPDSILTRTNHTTSEGSTSILNCLWTYVDKDGIVQRTEELRLTRFTHAEYCNAIKSAGLEASFDPDGCNGDGKGLWIGLMP
jgi:hypothetical protein